MTFDPQKSAREKTPFGEFQMHRSHLLTGPQGQPPKTAHGRRLTADERREEAEERERLGRHARRDVARLATVDDLTVTLPVRPYWLDELAEAAKDAAMDDLIQRVTRRPA